MHSCTGSILQAGNNKRHTGGTFCCLSKAFASVNHKFLLQKLKVWCVKVKVLGWLESYFGGRKQRVLLNSYYSQNCFSIWEIVYRGVPQRYVLGPLLFITYINDFPLKIRPISEIIMNADGTSVLISKPNYSDFKHLILLLCKL